MSASRRRQLLSLGLVGVVGLVVAAGAGAIEAPQELSVVCVDKRALVHQTVDARHCAKDETVHRLPQDRPFRACADLRSGVLRHVATMASCTSKERPVVVPDDGPVYVCSNNVQGGTLLNRGQLRRVDDAGQCNPRSETPYVTPAAPQPEPDAYTVSEDELLDVPARGVLVNDKDLTGAPLVARLVSGVAQGTLAFSSDGGFTYDPRGRFDGLDAGQKATEAFTYVANDGALDSAPATATLTVTGRNDAPVATADELSTDEDTILQVPAPGVLANDTDAEQHPLSAVLVAKPSKGVLALKPDGSLTYDPAGAFEGLGEGERAIATFTYLARDGSADSQAATVTITISGRNDPPKAAPDAYATDENTKLTVAAPGVLVNDTDAEGRSLSAERLAGPAAGDLELAADGGFTFDPRVALDHLEEGETARVTFTYRAVDAGGGASAPATVTISVTGRSVPQLADDGASTDEDTAVDVDVLANDRTLGGHITGIESLEGTAGDPDSTGRVRWTPTGFQDLQQGATRDGRFRYTVQNDEGSSTALVTIAVAGRNDAPVATADRFEADEEATLSVPASEGVLANDTDAEGDALSARLVRAPSSGRLTLRANGSLDFTPAGDLADGQSDPVTFGYRAYDGRDESATTTVTVLVNGVNDPPVVADQAFSVAESAAMGSSVGTVGFTDPDTGQSHTFMIDSGNVGEAFEIAAATGELTVKGALDAETQPLYELVVRVTDSGGRSGTGRVRVTVTDVDEVPLPRNDAYAAVGNTELAAGGAAPETPAARIDATNVLANDSDPDGGGLTVVADDGASDEGGSYAITATGAFTYRPRAGYVGPDAFRYTVDDGSKQAEATVAITVAHRVWYVDRSRPLPGDGTSGAPFTSIGRLMPDATTPDPDGPGDTVFVFSAGGDHPGAIELEAGQRLIGQGTDLVVGGSTLVRRATPSPSLSAAGAPAVDLDKDNEVSGIRLSATGAAAMTGADFGNLVAASDRIASTGGPALELTRGTVQAAIGELRSSGSPGSAVELDALQGSLTAATVDLSSSGGPAVRSSAGAATVTLAGGSISSSNGGVQVEGGAGRLDVGAAVATTGGRSVEVRDLAARTAAGCSVELRGPVSDTAAGILLDGNDDGARVCFGGPMTLQTLGETAFAARNGGTVRVAGTPSSIETTTGRGLDLEDIRIDAAGAEFQRVSTDGALVGIQVNALRAGGGRLAVNGSGGPDSGGVIRAARTGVFLSGARNVLLSGLRVTQSDGDGIDIDTGTDITLRQTMVEDSGGHGLSAQRVGGLTVGGGFTAQRNDGRGIELLDPTGSTAISQATLRANRGTSQLLVSSAQGGSSPPGPPTRLVTVGNTTVDGGSATGMEFASSANSSLGVVLGRPDGGAANFVRDGATGIRGQATGGGRLDIAVHELLRHGGTGDAVSLEASGLGAAGDRAELVFDVSGNSPDRGGLVTAPGGAGVRLRALTGGAMRGAVLNNRFDQPGLAGVVVEARGGHVEPQVGSNQVLRPGCRVPGGFESRCGAAETPRADCAAVSTGGLAGISVAASEGGTVAGELRRNEITDPLGRGITVTAEGASAEVGLSGNRVEQTLGCSVRATPVELAAAGAGGDLAITGGGNTVVLTSAIQDAMTLEAMSSARADAVLTADRLSGGRDGLRARALQAKLDVAVSRLRRTGGVGAGVRLSSSPAGDLDFGVRDAAPAHGGEITGTGADGIAVEGRSGEVSGTISGNDISDAGGSGVRVDLSGLGEAITVDDNAIRNVRGSGVSIADIDAGGVRERLDLAVRRNAVTDVGDPALLPAAQPGPSQGDGIGVEVFRDGTVEVADNTIAGEVPGRGVVVASDAGAQPVNLLRNEVLSSGPTTDGHPGIQVVARRFGRPCVAADANESRPADPGAPGFSFRGLDGARVELEAFSHPSVEAWLAARGNTGTVDPFREVRPCA